MTYSGFSPARVIGPAFLGAAALLALPAAATAAQAEDHQGGVAALSDLRAAISEIVQADASNSTDRADYHRASQRAINALEGTRGPHYVAAAGNPGDAGGAIGHIDALLDRQETPVWADPLRGAEANLRVAVSYLQDASHARELMDFEVDVSRALIHMEVAEGRSTESGVFGGLEGALANTVLGVPGGAHEVDACAAAIPAGAYGTHGGYIAWVSVPAGAGTYNLVDAPGGNQVVVEGGAVVLHTAVAAAVAKTCAGGQGTPAPVSQHAMQGNGAAVTAAAQPAPAQPAPTQQASQPAPSQQGPSQSQQAPSQQAPSQQAASQPAPSQPAPSQQAPSQQASSQPAPSQPAQQASSGGALPALYTENQARTGQQLFASKCVSCHGANMQGVAAPSVAGNDFLKTAQQNGWTVSIIRYIVFKLMPLNASQSLSDQEYADVMAYLLASNCYPAGNKPFPTDNSGKLSAVKLAPVTTHPAHQNDKGVCTLG